MQLKIGEYTSPTLEQLHQARTNLDKVHLILSSSQRAVDSASIFKSFMKQYWKESQYDMETVCRLRRDLTSATSPRRQYRKTAAATVVSGRQQEAMRQYFSRSLIAPDYKEVQHG